MNNAVKINLECLVGFDLSYCSVDACAEYARCRARKKFFELSNEMFQVENAAMNLR